jgi:hypothetical protein
MPDQHSIAARRHRALMLIRIVALALSLLGSINLFYTFGLMIVLQDVESGIITIWDGSSRFAWAVALLVPAIVLLLLSRQLARWLIPVPRRECHECGYSLRGLASAAQRCPECGTDVSPRPAVTAGESAPRK